MTTSYSTNLELALPVQGELSGTWGDTVNNGITQYLDTAIAGSQIISGSQTAVTLTNTNGDASATNIAQVGSGASGTAQYQIIRCTGNPASLLTITVSDTGTAGYSKTFVIINATSTNQSVKIVGSGPTTGVTVLSGAKSLVAWNGSDFVEIASSTADGVTTFSAGTTGFTPSTATSGAVTLAGTLATTNGGTGLTSFTSGGAVYATSTSALTTGILPTSSGGTGTASPGLVQGTNVTITGTWPNQTINASNSGGTVTSVGGTGTVNGLSLSGTVTSSGNLTLGGTLSGVANSALTNSSVTVTAGTGLSGGGAVALGSSVTLSNAGVTSVSAGTGIAVSASTGGVTISTTGGGGGLLGMAVFTSSGSWTVPSGVTKAQVVVTGGGGGGGNPFAGSAGGTAIYMFTVSAGNTMSITVGAGGPGSTSSNAGTSSATYGGYTVQGTGGGGGATGYNTGFPSPGYGYSGDINLVGGGGSRGSGASGGGSYWGGGGNGATSSPYGAGGGMDVNGYYAAGGSGVVVIYY